MLCGLKMNACFKDDKLIRLSTLAEQTGISIHCIRTYIDRGLIQVNDRTAGGMFLFYESVIDRLRFIRMARDVGVPLEQIDRLLSGRDDKDVDATETSLAELTQYIETCRDRLNCFEQSLKQHLGIVL
ncbi:MerR family transcriptional regulator [Methylomonas methanica]|nr:MerR family transcriptional regulator [Methylomonas methanica]